MAGEGSRGGHVIGHTKSGKPIYSSGSGKYPAGRAHLGQRTRDAFPNYTAEDHEDARRAHRDQSGQGERWDLSIGPGSTLPESAHAEAADDLYREEGRPRVVARDRRGDFNPQGHGHIPPGKRGTMQKALEPYLGDPVRRQAVELLAGHLFGKQVGELDEPEAAQVAARIEERDAPLRKALAETGVREQVRLGTLRPQEADAILKGGGEGSHGGHVIGHTKSGKPIYGLKHGAYGHGGGKGKEFSTAYHGFTGQDHKDAAAGHMAAMESAPDEATGDAHSVAAQIHRAAGDDAGPKGLGNSKKLRENAFWHRSMVNNSTLGAGMTGDQESRSRKEHQRRSTAAYQQAEDVDAAAGEHLPADQWHSTGNMGTFDTSHGAYSVDPAHGKAGWDTSGPYRASYLSHASGNYQDLGTHSGGMAEAQEAARQHHSAMRTEQGRAAAGGYHLPRNYNPVAHGPFDPGKVKRGADRLKIQKSLLDLATDLAPFAAIMKAGFNLPARETDPDPDPIAKADPDDDGDDDSDGDDDEACANCGAEHEKGGDGKCNRCGKSFTRKTPPADFRGAETPDGEGMAKGGMAKALSPLVADLQPFLAIMKAGEGSRGGHVTGHTKSGEPIYAHSGGKPSPWIGVADSPGSSMARPSAAKYPPHPAFHEWGADSVHGYIAHLKASHANGGKYSVRQPFRGEQGFRVVRHGSFQHRDKSKTYAESAKQFPTAKDAMDTLAKHRAAGTEPEWEKY